MMEVAKENRNICNSDKLRLIRLDTEGIGLLVTGYDELAGFVTITLDKLAVHVQKVS